MDLSELTMILESVSPCGVTQKDFEDAAATANSMNNIPTENQSTVGNITTSEPPTDYIDKLKWESWKNFEGYPQQSAANAYVFLVNELKREFESSSTSKPGTESDMTTMTLTAMSTFQDAVGDEEAKEWSAAEELCQLVSARDLNRCLACIASGADVNMTTAEGMTPLHFAADVGDCGLVSMLLQAGAGLNAQDADGQTPLMLAALCDHQDVVQLLLEAGADVELVNAEGKTAYQLDDVSEAVASLIGGDNSSR